MTVIIPSFHSFDLDLICIKSFEKFCPSGLKITYIVIENSDSVAFKNDVCRLAENVVWKNNNTKARGSEANAESLDIGLKMVETDLVFMAHCDVCVTSYDFFDILLSKYNGGNGVVGTIFDKHPDRIKALHISGLLTDVKLARSVKYLPRYCGSVMKLDVGDEITEYCRRNNIRTYCFNNTYNDEALTCKQTKYGDFLVDRCLDDYGNVIYMHLGRGIPKLQGVYSKPGRIGIEEWKEFCGGII